MICPICSRMMRDVSKKAEPDRIIWFTCECGTAQTQVDWIDLCNVIIELDEESKSAAGWHYQGTKYTDAEFQRLLKLKAFL